MGSYSPGSLMLANGGNTVHSIYIFSLPPGPIWILHSFHVVVTLFMLSWYLRHEGTPGTLRNALFRLHIRTRTTPSTNASPGSVDPLTIR
jgi:hypothetical protein